MTELPRGKSQRARVTEKRERERAELGQAKGSSWGFWVSLGAGTLVPSVKMIFINT